MKCYVFCNFVYPINYNRLARKRIMSGTNVERDTSELPSEHFHLNEEYWELGATEAKVELQERTKELGAITRANELFGELDGPIDNLIHTYVDEIAAWFQYPSVTEAQITVGTTVVESEGFVRTSQPLAHEAVTKSGTRALIEVVYTEERPVEDDGPWLTEEHNLLETLISFIKNYQSQWENRNQLERQMEQQRSVAKQVKYGVDDVQKKSRKVMEKTREINKRADNSSDSMAEVSNEIADMSATIEEIASTSEEVAVSSESALQHSEEGRIAATEAIEVMNRIDDSTQEVSGDVDSLQKRVDAIDEVVEVINDIADKTNILALNASIEAARAGEAGSGFAVVADEVKSLAGDSQEHANEIERMIREIKSDAGRTVESLEETTEQVDDGIEKVQGAMNTLEEISESVEETSQGIREVSNATDSQAVSTEEVASMVNGQVEDSEAISDEIDDVAVITKQQVDMVDDIDRQVQNLVD